jgi:fibronectin type 3 domain-containing protein
MTYIKFILGSILVLTVCMNPTPVAATSLELSWSANTESDLAGYVVSYGNTSSNYTSSVDVGKVTSYEINNVTTGKTYYVTLTAYDKSGNESADSQEVSVYVPVTTTPPVLSTTPSILLLSPIVGTVLSKPPILSWSATSLTTFTLYMALNNGSYSKMWTGTNTSHTMASYLWYLFIPSGSTLKWYVVGTSSSGQQASSAVCYFKKA